MAENDKTPAIRFAGFTDDWEQHKAKELCSITTGKSNTQDQVDDGIYPFYIRSDTPVKSNKYLYDEEAVITIGDGNIGKVFHYVNGKFDLHQRCYKMTNFDIVNAKYFYWYFSTKFYERAMSMTAKTSVDSVRLEMISEMDIKNPRERTEQDSISSLLFGIDNLITLHQRKCDKLINVKKSLLEKMFPSDGEKTPKIRFRGFTDDWEQCKLGSLMEVTSVKRILQSDWTSSGIRFLRARDIVCDYKNEEPDDYLYISEKKYDEYTAISGKVKIDDLLVTGVGTIGIPMLIKNDNPVYFKDGNIIWFKNNSKIDGKFFYYSFISSSIQRYIIESAGTGTVGTYTIDSGKNTPINLPENGEQEKIGELLNKLSNLITLHQRECEKLKNIKKSLLEKMFV